MRLVEQITLYYQEGSSDKVYEVDLSELEPGQFVVNFRYGRRGAALREGSKTDSPVAEAKARAIFDKLVRSKEQKGYRRGMAGLEAQKVATPVPPPTTEPKKGVHPKQAQALLKALGQGDRGDTPLDRTIWRVGELAIKDAEPLLLEILALPATTNERRRLRCYSLLWALGKCGSSAAVASVSKFHKNESISAEARAMAAETLRILGDDEMRKALQAEEVARMTKPLASAFGEGSVGAVRSALYSLERPRDEQFAGDLVALYRCADDRFAAPLLEALALLPLQRGTFFALRAIFKLAEFRRDAQVYGHIAYIFESNHANYAGWYDEKVVFKTATRRYLRRRVGRVLRRLSEDGSPDFVPMAVGVLLPFTDDDAKKPMRRNYSVWNYQSRNTTSHHVCWDAYSSYWAFNTVLYSNSDRYFPDKSGRAWRCVEGYTPAHVASGAGGASRGANSNNRAIVAGGINIGKREEAAPKLWNQRPEALLHLIDESRCEPVHEMAAKALRECRDFCASLELEALALLLQAPYDISAKLGFDLIQSRPMSLELARLLVESRLLAARAHAHSWLRVGLPKDDSALWATLIISPYGDNREFARSALRGSLLSDDVAQSVIARVLAVYSESDLESESAHFLASAQILIEALPKQARSLGESVLRDLLTHPALAVQEVGGEFLLHSDRLSSAVPEDLLIALLDSEHAAMRTVGTRLLDKLPDEELAAHPELFNHLALHELADLRQSCRATIERLARHHEVFARALAAHLCEALLRKLPKGAPADAIFLLRGPLLQHLPAADKDQAMRLLRAKSPHARELGALYLKLIESDQLSLFDIVKLADHELVGVREAGWAHCEASVDRFRLTMPALARLLDSNWEDTRQFALAFIEKSFGPSDLGPAALIAFCDSVRPEVQRFGQALISQNFRDEDGQEYLAKLSEHPSTNLQLFVTNYLERYAADDPAKLEELSTYCLSVLSKVSSGGVAKRRVLSFLQSEGLKSEKAAQIVARIFSRQSVTIAIQNKASIIESMVALREKYPELDLPIRLSPPEVRRAV